MYISGCPCIKKKSQTEFNEEEVFTATVTFDFAKQLDDSNLGIRFNLKETSRPESKGKKVESRRESLIDRILLNLEKEPLSKAELAIHLGHRGVSGQLNKGCVRLMMWL